jgi:hypothetical protein
MVSIEKIANAVKIDHVFIPIRDYQTSAKSRATRGKSEGGLWFAENADAQLLFYYKIMAEYLRVMVKYEIPTTFIDFEKMVKSPEYLFEKLTPVLYGKTLLEFRQAWGLATAAAAPTRQST